MKIILRLAIIVIAICSTSCVVVARPNSGLFAPGHHSNGPGNSENAPGHNKK
ncbi:MAG: hypothetical protein AAB263_20340 [Planctomycetota bacterium]